MGSSDCADPAVRTGLRFPQRAAACRPGLPVPGVSDADRRRRVRRDGGQARSLPLLLGVGVARGADRRHRLVPRRPSLRHAHSADALPRVAVAGFLRAADRIDFPALRARRRCCSPSSCRDSRRSRPRWPARCGFRYWEFVLFDAIGAGLWVGVGVGLGYVFRDAIDDVMDDAGTRSASYGLLLVIAGFRRAGSWSNGGGASCSSSSCAWIAFRSTSCARLIDGKQVSTIVDVRSR